MKICVLKLDGAASQIFIGVERQILPLIHPISVKQDGVPNLKRQYAAAGSRTPGFLRSLHRAEWR